MTRSRAPRGSLQVFPVGNRLYIRCTHNGKSLRRSLGVDNNIDGQNRAAEIKAAIKRDMAYGEFKGDLKPYISSAPKAQTTAELFSAWIKYLIDCNTPLATIEGRYKDLQSNLKKWGKPVGTTEQAAAFLQHMRSRQKASTTNKYLTLLKAWGEWCRDENHWEQNPFKPIRNFPGASQSAEGMPFSLDEMARILAELGNGEIVKCRNGASRLVGDFSHYQDFTYFLFATGVRPSEAIALRWGMVSLSGGHITIAETVTRAKSGSKRERKAPKTGSKGIRRIPITPVLAELLRDRKPSHAHPNALVFPGPKGALVDDGNYAQRVWRPKLEAAGVTRRKVYFCRHTFASWAIAAGMTYPQVAQLLGHVNTRMLQQTYGRSANPDPRIMVENYSIMVDGLEQETPMLVVPRDVVAIGSGEKVVELRGIG